MDPWFGAPLWLKAPFRGHTLWAFNVHHAEHLRGYIAATLRERKAERLASCGCRDLQMSMVEKLPVWMKEAPNRDRLVSLLDDMITAERDLAD